MPEKTSNQFDDDRIEDSRRIAVSRGRTVQLDDAELSRLSEIEDQDPERWDGMS